MKVTRSKAVSLADKWFSLFIRLYHSDFRGKCKCVTCPATRYFREMDCGHFMSRAHMATRYDEKNVGPQCAQCNKWGQGQQFRFSRYIDSRYGKKTSEILEVAAHSTTKIPTDEILAIAKKYRDLALLEAEKRGIDLKEPKTNRILDERKA